MANGTFGQYLKERRNSARLSLRKFAEKLGVSAAFLVDLEKDRRIPSSQLLQKIADELDLPMSSFDQFSPMLPKSVREWVDRHPFLGRALKLFTRLPDPVNALSVLEQSTKPRRSRRYPMAIYESELQAIALESSSWVTETGGDLFGIWGDLPIVYLATKAGPKSVRDQAHFRLDVDYLIKLSIQMDQDWGLRYFGDWHSHHRLGLQTPSSGDRDRIQRVAGKNNFDEMAEFIVTFSPSYNTDQKIHIHPYAYLQLPSAGLTDVAPIVLKGVSPVRESLAMANVLPEQDFTSSSSFSLGRVVIPEEPLPRINGHEGPVLKPITDTVIRRAVRQLETITSNHVEVHETAFGYIIVVPFTDDEHLAIAIDQSWPHKVLQLDWMNRTIGKTEEMDLSLDSASPVNLSSFLNLIEVARKRKQE